MLFCHVNLFKCAHCIQLTLVRFWSPSYRDCPQMVQLHKIPSEFATSRMRDSFMRQFIEQGSDGYEFTLGAESTDDLRTVSKLAAVPLLNDSKHKSVTSTPQKKEQVSIIIRSVFCSTHAHVHMPSVHYSHTLIHPLYITHTHACNNKVCPLHYSVMLLYPLQYSLSLFCPVYSTLMLICSLYIIHTQAHMSTVHYSHARMLSKLVTLTPICPLYITHAHVSVHLK